MGGASRRRKTRGQGDGSSDGGSSDICEIDYWVRGGGGGDEECGGEEVKEGGEGGAAGSEVQSEAFMETISYIQRSCVVSVCVLNLDSLSFRDDVRCVRIVLYRLGLSERTVAWYFGHC